MRFFIALEIPEESKEQLYIVQEKLKEILPQIRVTESYKFHLTLAFIGEQPDNLKELLVKVLEKSIFEITPFSVAPAYIDGFPSLHHAHTLWVGVKGDTDKLMIIRERIKDGLLHLNLSADTRRYTPHITLGKINNLELSSDQESRIQGIMLNSNFENIKITSLKLFESIARDGFHDHNTLAEVKL